MERFPQFVVRSRRYRFPCTGTQNAGEGQIVWTGKSAMFPADNMVDLVRKTSVGFMNQTVFATLIGSPGYFNTNFIAYVTGHER